jgi:toxin ParE1/3/4
MNRYRLTADARRDLSEILNYIAQDSLTAAYKQRDVFEEKFAFLAANPLMGELRNDLGTSIRLFTCGNYVILYRPESTHVSILHVVHGARDLTALLGDRGS